MPKKVSFALPDKFDGAPEQCKGFIRQAEIFFKHQGEGFESEEKKCAFLMSLLTGKAINWATAVWEKEKKNHRSYHPTHISFNKPEMCLSIQLEAGMSRYNYYNYLKAANQPLIMP